MSYGPIEITQTTVYSLEYLLSTTIGGLRAQI